MLSDTNEQILAPQPLATATSGHSEFPAAEVRSALQRIVNSKAFIHSHRIRTFLQFVVEESLADQHHRLKEYLIGLEVFNRSAVFDPRVDSIVRVEARRLRAKLDEYYLTEGRDEELRIVLRKGSYVPIFEYRHNNPLGLSSGSLHSLRRSLALAPVVMRDGGEQGAALAGEIARRITHILIKEGCFQVLETIPAAESTAPTPDYIVEASVELNGEHVRLLLQLLNVSDSSRVWSEIVECAIHDLTPVDNLGRALNRELLAPSGEGARAKLRGEHRQAYDYYLQGRFDWRQGAPESIRSSVHLFRQAVEADPSYGAAWAALAEASALSSLLGLAELTMGDEAKAAAQRACTLNPNLPEVHVALGAALSIFDFDWAAGEKELQRAIQLGPADPTAHVAYGAQLAFRGLHQQAIVEVERALELNPASLLPNVVLGWLYGVAGRLDEAITQHSQVAKMAPDFAFSQAGLGWAYAAKGMFDEAVLHLQTAGSLLPGMLGYCLAKAGRTEEARSQAPQLSPLGQAAIYSGLGDRDQVLSLLEQAQAERDPTLPMRLWGPEFAGFRNEPQLRSQFHSQLDSWLRALQPQA